MIARHIGGVHRGLLRRKRSALTRPAEAERTRALPRQRISLAIGDGHNSVVERRLNVDQAVGHILALALLELLVLAGLPGSACCWLSHGYLPVTFFLPVIVPLRGPLRVRALVCDRWPRVGRLRLWRSPRYD